MIEFAHSIRDGSWPDAYEFCDLLSMHVKCISKSTLAGKQLLESSLPDSIVSRAADCHGHCERFPLLGYTKKEGLLYS